MDDKKEIGILGVNLVYLITAVLLLTIGAYVQQKEVKTGLLITEYILVLLPPVLYTKIRKEDFARVFRLNKLRIKHGVLVMLITILSYPVALFFNLVVMTLLSTLGKLSQPPIPTANNAREYFLLIIIMALSAGICEEVFFRGFIMRKYEGFGPKKAIIIAAVLFGVFHFNIQNFAGPVVLGLIFGYLVYRTNSLIAGILGHITNNAVAVTLGFITNLANKKLVQSGISPVQQMPNSMQMVAAVFFIGVIALLSGMGAYGLLRIIIKDTNYAIAKNSLISVEKMEIPRKTESVSLVGMLPIFITVITFFYISYRQIQYIMTQ